MRRRDFIKTTLSIMAAAGLAPDLLRATEMATLPLGDVSLDKNIYSANQAQTLLVFLVGGMSDFVGNATHLEQIRKEDLSEKPYPETGFTVTKDGFWQEGGGAALQSMLDDDTLQTTYFRTSMAKDESRSHGLNQRRFMHGHPTIESGMPITLLHVLNRYNLVDENTLMPYVRLRGGLQFYDDRGVGYTLPGHLRPVTIEAPNSIGGSMSNPYQRDSIWDDEAIESAIENYSYEMNDFNDPISSAMQRRKAISDFIEKIRSEPLPDGVEYPATLTGGTIETAMRILISNPDTKVVSTEPANRWDDHSGALTGHKVHATELFEAIFAAMKHMKAAGRDNINIVVYGDFGRNYNINGSDGWDHGNNQVVYWFGGERYLNSLGVVGETDLHVWMKKARLYSRPKEGSFEFEPYSIASTFYRLYGITNPEVLTGGYGIISPAGQNFLKV
ncbi:hypothetical protein NNO_0487 [Hydrogenimonas sp.]|nr:hypothetical protein NNO_0487 [Hydrogenimonas sp.]